MLDIIAAVTFQAVFFDAGETLLYPHPSFPELLSLVLKDHGYDIDPGRVRQRVQKVSERFLQAAREGELWSTTPERSRRFWSDVYRILLVELGVPFDDALAASLYRTFTDLSNYRLFPDAESTLTRLRDQGLVLGVVSNFEEWLERLLDSLGVARFFDVRIISGAEGVEKPDQRIFRLALDRTGTAAEDSVYVGDNPFFDIEPAATVGMYAVLIDRRGRHPDHPGPRITSLEELPSLLELAA